MPLPLAMYTRNRDRLKYTLTFKTLCTFTSVAFTITMVEPFGNDPT